MPTHVLIRTRQPQSDRSVFVLTPALLFEPVELARRAISTQSEILMSSEDPPPKPEADELDSDSLSDLEKEAPEDADERDPLRAHRLYTV